MLPKKRKGEPAILETKERLNTMNSIAESWKRIDTWLQTFAPARATELHPGVTPEELAHQISHKQNRNIREVFPPFLEV
jgi:cell wall assembly regulator SMI1